MLATFDWGDAPTRVLAAPHPDGIWVVFRAVVGMDDRIWALRFDEVFGTALGPIQISEFLPGTLEIAAAPFGSGLAVAWRQQSKGSSTELRIVDENGAVKTSASFQDLGKLEGPFAMVASEAHGSVVMSFQGATPSRVRLARVDCLVPHQ